jgi:hypothetical protein
MKVLSVRRGFLADHSSTSYEFLAIDKPLDASARAAVSRLSSRARPTSRRVSFIYHADGYDIPGGWDDLMRRYYDVMYSESYDWWTLAVAFSSNDDALIAKLHDYSFDGIDDLGVDVSCKRGRVVVTISCRLAADALAGGSWTDSYSGDGYDLDDQAVDDGIAIATGDDLLDLLARVRSCLMRGECEPLYAVWEEYGLDGDEEEDEAAAEAPPRPKETASGGQVAAELGGMLESS